MEAIQNHLTKKHIRTLTYKTDSPEITTWKSVHNFLEKADEQSFPIPDFFLCPENGNEDTSVIMYAHECQVGFEDLDFELFFALQYYVTDPILFEEFLDFHLNNTFNRRGLHFLLFLNEISHKYFFLKEDQARNVLLQDMVNRQYFTQEKKTEDNIILDESNDKRLMTTPKGTNEITLARQVLAIHYLLEYCDVKNIDKAAIARFVQFLTGKETGAKEIKNTNIYKKVVKPFSQDDRTLNNDLQFVRIYFENLGLTDIVQKITKEISQSKR